MLDKHEHVIEIEQRYRSMKEIVRQTKLTEDALDGSGGIREDLPVGKNEIEAAEERY